MTHRSLRVTFWFLNFEFFFGVSKYLPTIFVDASKPHMFDASLMLQSPIAPKMGYPQIIQVMDDHFDIETHRDLGILYHLISFKGLASHALALKEEHAWLLVAASFRWMKSCN